MSESSAWATLRQSLKAVAADKGSPVDIQRIEDSITAGIPDANICFKGREIWLEGKYIEALPKRLTTMVKIPLRVEQVTWLENRQRAGGDCYVWCRISGVGWLLIHDEFRQCKDGMLWEDMVSKFELFRNSRELVKWVL